MGHFPEELRGRVESYLQGLDFGEYESVAGLVEVMRYALLAGGKRVRPVLTLATAERLGQEPESCLATAAAVEMVHAYSLIHDDLPAIDDDDLRRGRPSTHVAFGEGIAIIAGDALFAEAFGQIATQDVAEKVKEKLTIELYSASGVSGMAGGQYLDMTQSGEVDLDQLTQMCKLKTGRLIEASVACGCIQAQAGSDTEEGLRSFALQLGLLFQVVDDILDVEGDELQMGKRSGSDSRQGKRTFATLMGVDGARSYAGELYAGALDSLKRLGIEGKLLQIAEYVYARTA